VKPDSRDPIDRLGALLPWINGDDVPVRVVTRTLRAFIESFDGGESAGHVVVARGGRNPSIPAGVVSETRPRHVKEWLRVNDEDALDQMRAVLHEMLTAGLADHNDKWAFLPTSLEIGVLNARRARPTKTMARAERKTARRVFNTSGAYALVVDGSPEDLVPFLVAHLLTMPGAARVIRCAARAPHSTDPCRRFRISKGRGRPPLHCKENCRVRTHYDSHPTNTVKKLRQHLGRRK